MFCLCVFIIYWRYRLYLFRADHAIRINSSTLYSLSSGDDVVGILESLRDDLVFYEPGDFDLFKFARVSSLKSQFSKFGDVVFFDGGMNLFLDDRLLFSIDMIPVDFVRDNHDVIVSDEIFSLLGDFNNLSDRVLELIRLGNDSDTLTVLLCLDRLCSYCDEVGCGVVWDRC